MLLGTQYMRHAHQVIVHNNCKIIGRNAVGFHDNEVIELIHTISNITVNQIMEYQQRSAGFRAIREGEFMAEYIKLFNERTK